MKNAIILYCLFTLLLGCAEKTNSSEESNVLALTGVTIYDGNGNKIENASILISGDSISAIGSSILIPKHAKLLDLKGKYITPGLVDAHMHFFQTAFFDSRPDAADITDSLPYLDVIAYQKANPERYYESYLRSGITGLYDVGGLPSSIELQRDAENNLYAPHVAAAGMLITPFPEDRIEGFNTPEEKVMVHLASDSIGRWAVRENSELGSTGIKIWGISPNDPVFVQRLEAVADEIDKQENKMIVHATSLEGAKLALNKGAKLLVHSVQDALVDKEFIELLKKNNTIYTPTLIVGMGYYNAYNALLGNGFEIKDPNGVVDPKTRNMLENAPKFQKFLKPKTKEGLSMGMTSRLAWLLQEQKIMQANLKLVYDAGGIIVVGTDAGNPGTLHGVSFFDEIEAMQDAGIPPTDLIVMATKNGAKAMERIDDFGTLEVGKMADLIILDKDPGQNISNLRSIKKVMRSGKFNDVHVPFKIQ